MELIGVLQHVELFDGVPQNELEEIAAICKQHTFKAGDLVTEQGQPGDELFIIQEGFVEVLRDSAKEDPSPKAVVNLGRGQIVGEMALVDRGPRSATVRAVSDQTLVQVISRDDFERLCEANYRLGYIVMRNIAADLSFKLRHRHLASR